MGYQSIYDRLRAAGLSQAGALALMGNFDCESNCEPVRVQGDFDPYRRASKQYVEDLATGKINRESFMRDGKGFGIAQWTYFLRKGSLYDFWRAKVGSIGDESLQVDFTLLELRSDFGGLLEELKTSADLYACTKDVCYKFENPAVKNVDARFASAKKIMGMIDLDGGGEPQPEPEPEPEPQPEPTPSQESWPPRTVDKNCSGFNEVYLLQSILLCRGYTITPDGTFGSYLDGIVKDFQMENGLTIDGVVGPMTWNKLLERG